MKNIEILVKLKEQAEVADFMIDDLAVRMELENVEFDELISKEDDDIYKLLEQIGKINVSLAMLTEDLRTSLDNEGFNCEAYATWCNQIKYDVMRLARLVETFEESHEALEWYVDEMVREYRILTQDGYGTQE